SLTPEDWEQEKNRSVIYQRVDHINQTVDKLNRLKNITDKIRQTYEPIVQRLGSRLSEVLMEIDLPNDCMRSLITIMTGIKDGKQWVKPFLFFIMDTLMIPESGIITHKKPHIGYDECLQIQSSSAPNILEFSGQYCWLGAPTIVPNERTYDELSALHFCQYIYYGYANGFMSAHNMSATGYRMDIWFINCIDNTIDFILLFGPIYMEITQIGINFRSANNGRYFIDISLSTSWQRYISSDYQLYILAPIVFLVLFRWPRIGLLWNIVVILIGIFIGVAPRVLFDIKHYFEYQFDTLWSTQNSVILYYWRPDSHVVSYAIGILCGYLIREKPNLYLGGRVGEVFLWISCTTSTMLSIYWDLSLHRGYRLKFV
ncbi:unnamed protein product, partial [Medioppia subpectinata]